MKNYKEYPHGTGHLKQYNGEWFVLDDKMLIQYRLEGNEVEFKDGLPVNYNIRINDDDELDRWAVLIK